MATDFNGPHKADRQLDASLSFDFDSLMQAAESKLEERAAAKASKGSKAASRSKATSQPKGESDYARKKRREPDVLFSAANAVESEKDSLRISKLVSSIMPEEAAEVGLAANDSNQNNDQDLDIKSDIVVDAETSKLGKQLGSRKPKNGKSKESKTKNDERPLKVVLGAANPELPPPPIEDKRISGDMTNEEEEIGKRVVIVLRYQSNKMFGEHLKTMGIKYTPEQLRKKSMQDLDGIINQIRLICRSKSAAFDLSGLVFTGTSMFENVVTARTKYNIRGYTENLKADEDFVEALELYKLEKMSFINMSTEVRIMKGLALNLVGTYSLNMQREKADIYKNQMAQMGKTGFDDKDFQIDAPANKADLPANKADDKANNEKSKTRKNQRDKFGVSADLLN